MAESNSHRFGQIIGNALETAVEPLLRDIANKHGLYLDQHGKRLARKGKKLSWVDLYENKHDLDYVLERLGSDETIGTPVAFIEIAWRRYTKHSRNKAQEIQGAVTPLVSTFWKDAPFAGAILAGDFTDGAITQLESLNFKVLYFPYLTMVEAFTKVGMDASFDEGTAEEEFASKVAAWEALSEPQRLEVAKALLELNDNRVTQFRAVLEKVIMRQIETIHVLPLHGVRASYSSIAEAIEFINEYKESAGGRPVVKYEVIIRYNNGDKIEGQFGDKATAIQFLRSYQSPFKPSS